jgi:hypothetical protein
MKKQLISQAVRFNIEHPDLCPALKWKGQFTHTSDDPTVPSVRDNQYWCVFTQTCVEPDGHLAEPYECSSVTRTCHRHARRELFK